MELSLDEDWCSCSLNASSVAYFFTYSEEKKTNFFTYSEEEKNTYFFT